MVDTELDSPSTLAVKLKPKKLQRMGKKPMMIVISIMAIVGVIITYEIAHEKPTTLTRADAEKNLKLQPATNIADEINGKISDKAVLNTNNTSDIATQNTTELLPLTHEDSALKNLTQDREAKLKGAMVSATDVEQFKKLASELQNPSTLTGTSTPKPILSSNQIVPPLVADEDQNKQLQKEAFLNRATQNQYAQYLDSTRKAPLSQLEIKTGTVIPSVLVTGVNSDLPGQMIAQVTENVYDTATGRHLLIPQGTKIYGMYDSNIAYGQERILVAWQRLIFPDASTIELGGMTGADKGGYAGFNDQVNNHYGRLIGFGLATSLFSSLFQISQKDNNSNNGQLTSSQIAAATTAQNITQLGIDVTKKNLNIQPTIEIRPGYRFVIMVNKDVIFPEVYQK